MASNKEKFKKQKLIDDFILFRDCCIILRRNFNTYYELVDENNRRILEKTAVVFFSDILLIMKRDWLLQASKIFDPKIMCKNENITLELINHQLKNLSLYNDEIEKINKNLFDYGKK